MSKPRSKPKGLIITDDDEEEEVKQEMNPFSFKEFLRSQNLDQTEPGPDQDQQDQETDWGHSWTSGGGTSAESFCTEEDEEVTRFDSRPDYEGDDETSILESESRTRTRTSLQQMKQENEELKRTISELKQTSLKNQLRSEELSAELLQRQRQDQQEALDLETMVQSVEHNLRLMTKRAVKAEGSVSKLKTEVKQLQERLEELSSENAALKASESELVLMMKQNAQTASDTLQQTALHAHASVRRLLSEAESLKFVSELLQSIDRMSSVR